jgi:hypothetical protein
MKRKGLHTAATVMQLVQDRDTVEIPNYVTLTPEEAALWPIFASSRSRGDWRKSELLLLAKVVQWEVDMRQSRAELAKLGRVIRQHNGNHVANPLMEIITRLHRQQMQVIHALSLTVGADGRTLAGREKRTRTFTQALARDDDALLAKPR